VPKIHKKRMGFVVDMTPLVDITFLLLCFMMFTAKFKSESESEQQYQVTRPYSSIDTTKVPEKDLAKVIITIDKKKPTDTVMLLYVSNIEDRQKIALDQPQIAGAFANEQSIAIDTTNLEKLTKSIVKANPNIKISIDADKDVSFSKVFSAMQVMSRDFKLARLSSQSIKIITLPRAE
jgi:biopolymer transport protein ExbD